MIDKVKLEINVERGNGGDKLTFSFNPSSGWEKMNANEFLTVMDSILTRIIDAIILFEKEDYFDADDVTIEDYWKFFMERGAALEKYMDSIEKTGLN